MEKTNIVVYLILIFAVIIGVYVVYGFFNESPSNKILNAQTNTQNALQQKYDTISTGTTDPGDVSVDLTPIEMNGGKIIFRIDVNTHSVDLSQYDLAKITTLEYNGDKINPVSAPKMQGHHTSGTIIFNTGKDIKSFKIAITEIPNIENRVFEWK